MKTYVKKKKNVWPARVRLICVQYVGQHLKKFNLYSVVSQEEVVIQDWLTPNPSTLSSSCFLLQILSEQPCRCVVSCFHSVCRDVDSRHCLWWLAILTGKEVKRLDVRRDDEHSESVPPWRWRTAACRCRGCSTSGSWRRHLHIRP